MKSLHGIIVAGINGCFDLMITTSDMPATGELRSLTPVKKLTGQENMTIACILQKWICLLKKANLDDLLTNK